MEALDKIRCYKLNDNVNTHLKYTLEEYKVYLDELQKLDPWVRNLFFKTIKDLEIKNNHEMEHEDPFMIELQMHTYSDKDINTSIDLITKMTIDGESLTNKALEQIHGLLIRGTTDDIPENYPIRTKEAKVCEVVDGKIRLQYVAPEPELVNFYLEKLYSFLGESSNNELDAFYKPILEHYYIAALQPFGNGNTRLARCLQYNEIFKLTRELLGYNIEKPALFLSSNYFMTRRYYRDLIARVTQEPNDENMNVWINYNLNMIDEQLNFCDTKLQKLKSSYRRNI